jgi:hypothetical protein
MCGHLEADVPGVLRAGERVSSRKVTLGPSCFGNQKPVGETGQRQKPQLLRGAWSAGGGGGAVGLGLDDGTLLAVWPGFQLEVLARGRVGPRLPFGFYLCDRLCILRTLLKPLKAPFTNPC